MHRTRPWYLIAALAAALLAAAPASGQATFNAVRTDPTSGVPQVFGWTPANGVANTVNFSYQSGSSTGPITVNPSAGTYSLTSLTLNSNAFPNSSFTIGDTATFNTNSLNAGATAGQFPTYFFNSAINSGAGPLTISRTGGGLTIVGALTGSGGVSVQGAGNITTFRSDGSLFNSYQNTGGLMVGTSSQVLFQNTINGSSPVTQTLADLTLNNASQFSIDGQNSTYTMTVSGTTTLTGTTATAGMNRSGDSITWNQTLLNNPTPSNGVRLTIGGASVPAAAQLNIIGGLQEAAPQTFTRNGNQTLNINTVSSTRTGNTLLLDGTTNLNVASALSTTGDVVIRSRAAPEIALSQTIVNVNVDGALGTGLVSVGHTGTGAPALPNPQLSAYGILNINAVQTGSPVARPRIEVLPFSVLAGDMTGMTFVNTAPVAAGQVRLFDNAVVNLSNADASFGTGTYGTGKFYQVVTANTGTFTVDPTSTVFKGFGFVSGAAGTAPATTFAGQFGNPVTSGVFTGTLQSVAGTPLELTIGTANIKYPTA